MWGWKLGSNVNDSITVLVFDRLVLAVYMQETSDWIYL